ncbi:hypothetical protein [Falsiroseomonas oryziterrae]|uniref:hypothetical protein n=1 Tax=Falsiroseomonas oryziterrae TaxID=2911368 RepID=UPI001F3F5DC5|nr:hypothetical protein [Roseomonas sp. NPKOSM-4]
MTLTVAELLARKEAEAARKRAEAEAAAEAARAERATFAARVMAYQITEEDKARARAKIAKAFEDGEREVMLAHFPSQICEDGGRRINNQLEGWQDTLPGAFRQVYEMWERDLKPGGFGFSARIISFPDGMPGEVGIFITWPQVFDR